MELALAADHAWASASNPIQATRGCVLMPMDLGEWQCIRISPSLSAAFRDVICAVYSLFSGQVLFTEVTSMWGNECDINSVSSPWIIETKCRIVTRSPSSKIIPLLLVLLTLYEFLELIGIHSNKTHQGQRIRLFIDLCSFQKFGLRWMSWMEPF